MRATIVLAVMLIAAPTWGARLSDEYFEPEGALAAAAGSAAPAPATHGDEAGSGLVLPRPALWSGLVVLGVLALFFLAAVVGIAVRANAPEELPPTHSHDEPPGGSQHHGPGGTIDSGHAHPH